MNSAKVVISFFLLLIYSVGFAHYLIPHNQRFELNVHAATYLKNGHHQHHQHTLEGHISSEHEHISHDNHFDEDFFDLVVCFFSETEHPVTSCKIQHYLPAATNNVFSRDSVKAKIVALLVMVFTESSLKESASGYNPDSDSSCLSPPLESSPHRGPPLSIVLNYEAFT